MNWLWSNLDLVWQLSLAHVALSVLPVVLGFAISLPLGWLAHRYQVGRSVLFTTATVLFTVPSLAMFIALPAVIGTSILDSVNVVIALTIYAVALMLRATADALDSVDADVRQSATGVGYSAWQRFWLVELPLAGPVLLAGLRVVSVSTVSLVTVGSVIGVTSLGYLFLNGFQRNIPIEVASGIIATVLIALIFDLALVALGTFLLPWNRRHRRAASPTTLRVSEAAGIG
ncbi:ABC transporter permease [Luethyella okanaganae]|uniref:ABC transporter permease n=1 Tax=Luethyella okanaganae TaxID=69372 RepID=A0ABW1VGH4_9MICO